ncbi:signal sequence peptidase [Thermococcus sp. 4557]|uniref:signal peptidase I n=1 Tax=Thermococcus sp. (strain CGMCC 1.5172 / 4557) TaxID=1042877 RepID=UPI000219EC1C|nr:signal peptidase I [Thermococcus sp. 4557]AEK73422.1 signal sequence peptidase [Thermococcus sp. 4557]
MVKRRIDVLSLISYFLLFFVVLVVVLHFVFGFQYVVILTDSMEPHINPNDLVVTMPSSPDGLHVGDVILYRVTIGNSTYKITHRIVDVRTDSGGRIYYVTRGDNRDYSDPWRVYPEQVLGRVVLVIPRVGVVWYYTPLIVFGIFLFIIASLAYDLAWLLLEEEPPRSKSRKADLVALRRKKIKVHHYRR